MKRNKKFAIDASKRQRGIDRKRHFESGGSLDAWRGRHSIEINKKRMSKRFACRKEIKDDE